MASWRDFARKVELPDSDGAISANSAISPSDGADEAPNGTNGTNGTASLPADVAAGLQRLKVMGVPRGVKPEAWSESVSDALRLADEGWASHALALGWSPLDLFGGVIERDGDPYADGLAVWLSGRKLLAITDDHAVVVNANGRRHFFNLPRAEGARLLWAIGGRGR